MSGESPYDVLFEPVSIGPVTTRNRFYQVPHADGFGHLRPRGHAAMRGVKAQGGWGVVSTGEAEIHPGSDLSPYSEQRLWDERDVPALNLMVESVHAHGALAAIELVYNGHHGANLFSRIPPLSPSGMVIEQTYPRQARAATRDDLAALRGWHRKAVRNAMDAGFDIIYVYAGHHMTLAQHFLDPQLNRRTDEYGGSLENRARLLRELLEDSLEVAQGKSAIALRLAVDHLRGAHGMQAEEEGRAVVELLAELPDLWDVNVAGWDNDTQTCRYAPEEGYQDDYTRFVKSVTGKPVVTVGRYTSPDRMASLIRRGHCDLIGAARPSIADPFLPDKIRTGRMEDIRECIGCNVCASSDALGVPIRCTQNPTMGEEWRRGWHPEEIAPGVNHDPVLVVGAGPAGLECALQLARRGHPVTLAEAREQPGGRALLESGLQGLASYRWVSDYRVGQLQRLDHVSIYRDSRLGADDVMELGLPHVMLATGATWRRDGLGRTRRKPIRDVDGTGRVAVLTPDDLYAGTRPGPGPVVIYDDDQGYLAGAIAEELARDHDDLWFISSQGAVSTWTTFTLEQARVHASLLRLGVRVITNHAPSALTGDGIEYTCIYSGSAREIPCATLVLVTERVPDDALAVALRERIASGAAHGIVTLQEIGDGFAPGLIADAVFSGHLAARNFLRDPGEVERELFAREMPALD